MNNMLPNDGFGSLNGMAREKLNFVRQKVRTLESFHYLRRKILVIDLLSGPFVGFRYAPL